MTYFTGGFVTSGELIGGEICRDDIIRADRLYAKSIFSVAPWKEETMIERLTIAKLPDGGFLVWNLDCHNGPHFSFAATSIDKALEYVKDKLQPPKTKAKPN